MALVELGALPKRFTQLVQQVLAIPSHRPHRSVWQGSQMVECCFDVSLTDYHFLFVATEHTASLYACAKDCLMRRIASVSRLFHTRRRSTCWNALQSSGVAFRILTAHLRKLATVALPWALAPFGRFGLGVRQTATGFALP